MRMHLSHVRTLHHILRTCTAYSAGQKYWNNCHLCKNGPEKGSEEVVHKLLGKFATV